MLIDDTTPDGRTYFDTTPRSGLLPDQEDSLAPARGCVFGLMFAAGFWALLFGWLFFAGFLLASIPTP
jgi:hypothetical protein